MEAEEKATQSFISVVPPVVLLALFAVAGWVLFDIGEPGFSKRWVELAALLVLLITLFWFAIAFLRTKGNAGDLRGGRTQVAKEGQGAGVVHIDSRYVDDLTGLSARFWFNESFRIEIARTRRYEHPLSIVLVTIDRFSHIGQFHGHGAADYVILTIAELLRKTVRQTDQLARLGDSEIAVVVPETNESGAIKVGEKIRRAVELYPFDEGMEITASVGVSLVRDSDNVETCLERVTAAASAARQRGGNAVVVSS